LEKVRCKRGSNCDREIATRIGHIEEYANWRQAGCF
jgi:hypothetical protein